MQPCHPACVACTWTSRPVLRVQPTTPPPPPKQKKGKKEEISEFQTFILSWFSSLEQRVKEGGEQEEWRKC